MMSTQIDRPVIESLIIRNYRMLRDVTFHNLTPLTVLFGPNGSGKSTVLDVFAFLHEAFHTGLRAAWVTRGGLAHIRSHGADGPVRIGLQFRADHNTPPVMYDLEIDEVDGRPVVVHETLRWIRSPDDSRATAIVSFELGSGTIWDDQSGTPVVESLDSPDLLIVAKFGGLSRYPQVTALFRFVTGWYLSHFRADNARLTSPAGEHHLSESGDNLASVVRYLQDHHPDHLEKIYRVLVEQVPQLERFEATPAADGRLALWLKDQPFVQPILANFVSDGTLKLLAYLTVLYDPNPASIIAIEEPENHLDGRVLHILGEEARKATERSQLLVTTHSAYFGNSLRPPEMWALYRAEDGFVRSVCAADLPKVVAMFNAGGLLGSLWIEGQFGLGNPHVRGGRPR